MLASSAPLLDEELLFSGLTRLARVNALMETRDALARLTGGRNYCISADLPCHLQEIVGRVGESIFQNNVDALIERHTLYPYYRFFAPANRWPHIRDIALSHEAGRLKGAMGILAHGVGATPVLRYCSICLGEMRKHFGTSYWHRAHHLPGVAVCAEHGCLLVFTMSQAQFGHRARLWPPPRSTATAPRKGSRAQHGLARVSLDALLYEGPCLGAKPMRDAYVGEILRRGWSRGKERPSFKPLIQTLRSELAEAVDWQVARRFGLADDRSMPWVHDLLGPRPSSCAPLAHIMLIQVLFGTFDRFVQACRGQAANQQDLLQLPSSAATVVPAQGRFEQAAAALDDRSRSCRQFAASFGVSVGWVVKQRRIAGIPINERRKTLNGERIAKANGLLAEGQPISAVARRCKLSASTIYRLLSADPVLVASRNNRLFERERDARRAQWVLAAGSDPSRGTRALRRAEPACYAWLYRNDRVWLQAHQPPKKRGHTAKHIDWEQRDTELAQRLTRLSPAFAAAESRLRTPAGAVSLVFPGSSMLKHADKLPRLAEAARSRAKAG
jgi:AraC-like DNA-binding protein